MTANTAERLIEDTQLSKVDLLLKEFNSVQLLWLSGYIAALGTHASEHKAYAPVQTRFTRQCDTHCESPICWKGSD